MIVIRSPADARNYGSRRGAQIDTIVIHTTQGSWEGAVAWFKDFDAQASAHFVISHDGLIVQCVDEDFAAWHAGNGAVNRRSIGIECEGDCDRAETWTPALVAALCELGRDLVKRFGIRPDRDHVYGHEDVPDPRDPSKKGGAHHHRDPGRYMPWATFMAALVGAPDSHRLTERSNT